MTTQTTSKKELSIERVFDAPRQLVWDVWTTPEHIAQWYGPQGFSTSVESMDFQPGGNWKYVMRSPDGREMPIIGVFREIVEPEKIVTEDAYPGKTEDGKDKFLITTVTFQEQENQCQLTMHILFPTEEDCAQYEQSGAVWGWNSSFDRVDELLKTL